MPGRVARIRPGLIVGPRDRSDRFTYWPVRTARGGEILAPGAPRDLIQFIDVRDLAEFIIHALERRLAGVYNCDSPAGETTMGGLLDDCLAVSASDARFTWCDADFLLEQGVIPFQDLPVWLPARDEYRGFGQVSVAKAVAAGLGRRPVPVTVRDTLLWWNEQPVERRERLRAGLDPRREAEILRVWHDRG
jgi:2'-hydroxyisoflavone reductase